MKSLRISRNLALPLEAVTQTFAILAKRGAGKTYTALVMTEEMLKAGLQVVAVDPVGVCWGLRSSADGKRAGLPIVVLGGDHGDVPLESTAGETIANFVIEERQSAVLDLSLFRKNEQVRFMTDFAERLYLKNRSALHLVLDEADAFAPQRPMPGQQRMLGAIQDLVRRGRARGIGVTLVTQRAAVLSKDVLTQVEVLVALRTISPQDRKAVEAWIAAHDLEDKRDAFMESLPALPIGTTWFWSPGWLDIFRKVSVRKRETFDSSATPKAGARVTQPRKLAAVDLDELRTRIRSTIEKAAANDPRALRKRLFELERELRKKPALTEPEIKRVEVPVIAKAEISRLETGIGRLEKAVAPLTAALAEVAQALAKVSQNGRGRPADNTRLATAGGRIPRAQPIRRDSHPRLPQSETTVSASKQRILDALAFLEGIGITRADKTQLALMAEASPKSGGYFNNLGALRSAGLIDYPAPNTVTLTEAGRQAAHADAAPSTTQELHDRVRAKLPAPKWKLLEIIIGHYPAPLSKDDLAELAGVSATSGGYFNNLGSLRSLGLIDYPAPGQVVAQPMLFLEQ